MLKRLCVLLALVASTAFAGGLPDGVIEARLLPGWRDGNLHHAAIEFRLSPGWHTYWRVPGEAGIPPSFNFGGSGNMLSAGIQWPTPELFDQNGMTSIGYEGTLILPIVLRAEDPAAPIHLEVQLDLGVCREVCLPYSTDLWAELPPSGTADPAIRAAQADQAVTARAAGVKRTTCTAEPIADGLRVTTNVDVKASSGREHVVLELPDKSIWISDATVSRDGGTLTATAEMVAPTAKPFPLDRSALRVTVIAGGRAIDIQGCTGG